MKAPKIQMCLRNWLLLLFLAIVNVSAQTVNSRQTEADHYDEDITLEEAENLFKASLAKTKRYALLVNKLQI